METKEEDFVEHIYIASTHAYLLFFTNDGKVHWLKVHEIPEAKRDARGQGDGEPAPPRRGRAVAATRWRCGTSRPAATSSSPPARAG